MDVIRTLTNQDKGILYIFLIAHPDDESMFFMPTIRALLQRNNDFHQSNQFHILCLSNGNYDGLGIQREEELRKAAGIISDEIQVTVLDDSKLQDGPKQTWSKYYIATILNNFLVKLLSVSDKTSQKNLREYDFGKKKVVIVTFDNEGVSGHINHIHTHFGAVYFHARMKKIQQEQLSQRKNQARQSSPQSQTAKFQDKFVSSVEIRKGYDHLAHRTEIQLMVLQTISNPLVKYFSIDILIYMLFGLLWRYISPRYGAADRSNKNIASNDSKLEENFNDKPMQRLCIESEGEESCDYSINNEEIMFQIFAPYLIWNAMAAHASQFVWYRRLSVLFSRYSYENSLKIIRGDNSQCDDDSDILTKKKNF